MKILDYITMASLSGKNPSTSLFNFATDINAEVFPVEKDGVLVICEADNVEVKVKSGMKYDMYALCRLSKGLIAGSDNKDELIQFYTYLLKEEYVDLNCTSSNIVEQLEKVANNKLSNLNTTSSI